MDNRDFLDLVEWMVPRWPEVAAWEKPEYQAMYTDLEPYRACHVRSAVQRLWQQGRERPPRAGQIIRLMNEMGWFPPGPVRPALPPGSPVPWSQVAAERYGDPDLPIWRAALLEAEGDGDEGPGPV